VVRSYEISLYS